MQRELTKARAKNAALMRSNLTALMVIREADADIQDLLSTLQEECEALERAGVAVPDKCRALLDEANPVAAVTKPEQVDVDMDEPTSSTTSGDVGEPDRAAELNESSAAASDDEDRMETAGQ